MAGTLFGLGLMPQFDASGTIARGALLYLYDANTSTPVTSYSDFSLSTAQPNPLVADSGGRLPAFWLADGDYRARLTTSAGIEIFDELSITTIGASSGSSSGISQDTTTLIQTGDFIWNPVSGLRSGFVRANGLTIGSGSSGGTERANGDCQALFEFFWNNFDNTFCAVSTGRGASAAADFNANKTIATLNMTDCAALGLSGMGNTSSGLISDTAATAVGATTKTILQANLPAVNLSAASLTGSVATSISNGSAVLRFGSANTGTADAQTGTNFTAMKNSGSGDTLSLTSGTVTFGGNVPLGGSGTALSIIPKGRVGTWYVKL